MVAVELGLTDRVVIVTGGSRGIGLAVAKLITDEGGKVVLIGRTQATLDAAQDVCGGTSNALALVGDIAESDLPARAVATAVAKFGRIDGALLAGGSVEATPALTSPQSAWQQGFESAFLAPIRFLQAISTALPTREDNQDSSLLFLLGSALDGPAPGQAISAGLQPGLANLVGQLASEVGRRGVRVNALSLGRIDTDGRFALDAREGSPDSVRRRRENDIPLGRYGSAEEVARVAGFLLSPASSYVTGAVIPVDGGLRHSQ